MDDFPPLEDDEEVKEGKGLNILLAQIKDGNNSHKLNNEIRQILYLLCQHNRITERVYNNLIKSL